MRVVIKPMKKNNTLTIPANTGGETEIIDVRLFDDVRGILDNARQKAYTAVNFAMVEAYWNIGRLIVENKAARNVLYMVMD